MRRQLRRSFFVGFLLFFVLISSFRVAATPDAVFSDEFPPSSEPLWAVIAPAYSVNFNNRLRVEPNYATYEGPIIYRGISNGVKNSLASNGYWRIRSRFRYLDVTAYGTNALAVGTAAAGDPLSGATYDILGVHANASGANLIIGAMNNWGGRTWTRPLSEADDWWTVTLNVHGTSWDVVYRNTVTGQSFTDTGSSANLPEPSSISFGQQQVLLFTGYYSSFENDYVYIEVDSDAPTASHSLSGTQLVPASSFYNGDVTLNISASDAVCTSCINSGIRWIEYQIDGGTVVRVNAATASVVISGDGLHTFSYRTRDNTGSALNTSNWYSGAVGIDSQAPQTTASFSGTQVAGWYSSNPSITLTATDPNAPDHSGMGVSVYSINGASPITYSAPALISGDGLVTIDYASIDNAGNIESSQQSILQIDTLPPQITPIYTDTGSGGSGAWYSGTINVDVNASDSASGVALIEYNLDGSGWQNFTAPFNLSGDGSHSLDWRVTDNVGHQATLNETLQIDTIAPQSSAAIVSGTLSSGWYSSPAEIELTATDNASGIAEITYELDAEATQLYSGTFLVTTSGIHTIRYRALDNAGNLEVDNTLIVQLDLDAPVSSYSFDGTVGKNGWYLSGGNLSFSASDAESGLDSIEYEMGSGWQLFSGPFLLSGDGTYNILYRGTDLAGNTESSQTASIRIDSQAPSSSILVGANGAPQVAGWYTTAPDIAFSGTDAGSGIDFFSYNLNGGSSQLYSSPFLLNSSGEHLLNSQAQDIAGNLESPQSTTVRVDLDAPISSASYSGLVGSAGWYRGDVTVTLTANDTASGVAQIEYNLDASGWQLYSSPFEILGSGTHTLQYRSTDNVGHIESIQIDSIPIDSSLPTTSANLTGLQVAGWYTVNPTLTLNATDSPSGINSTAYTWAGSPAIYTAPVVLSGDGEQTLEFGSVDNAGNVELPQSQLVRIDTQAPVTTATYTDTGAGGSGGWYTGIVTVTLTASDAASGVVLIEYNLDGAGWQVYSSPFTLTGDGSHSLQYRATDLAGHIEALQTDSLNLDSTAPISSASLSGSLINGWYTTVPIVTLSATDNVSGIAEITYELDGGASQIYSSPVSITTSGNHSFSFRAQDNAGNIEADHSLNIPVDLEAPTSSATVTGTLGDNGWYISSLSISLTATDTHSGLDRIEYNLDAAGWLTYSSALNLSAEGSHSLQFRAVDVAGHIETVQSLNFGIDTSLPLLNLNLAGTLGDNGWYVSPVALSATASDAISGLDRIEYEMGAGWQPYTIPLNLNAEGSTAIQVVAYDLAGNLTNQSQLVRIDTLPPTMTSLVCPGIGAAEGFTIRSDALDATSGIVRYEFTRTASGGAVRLFSGTGNGQTIRNSGADGVTYTYSDFTFWDAAGNSYIAPETCTVRLETRATDTPRPTATDVNTATATASATPTASRTPSPTLTASSTVTATTENLFLTNTPLATGTEAAETVTATATPWSILDFLQTLLPPTSTARPSATATSTATASATATATASRTPSPTLTATASRTAIATASASATDTPIPAQAALPNENEDTGSGDDSGGGLEAALIAALILAGTAVEAAFLVAAAQKKEEEAVAAENAANAAAHEEYIQQLEEVKQADENWAKSMVEAWEAIGEQWLAATLVIVLGTAVCAYLIAHPGVYDDLPIGVACTDVYGAYTLPLDIASLDDTQIPSPQETGSPMGLALGSVSMMGILALPAVKRSRTQGKWFLLLTVLLVALSGCSGDGDSSSTPSPSPIVTVHIQQTPQGQVTYIPADNTPQYRSQFCLTFTVEFNDPSNPLKASLNPEQSGDWPEFARYRWEIINLSDGLVRKINEGTAVSDLPTIEYIFPGSGNYIVQLVPLDEGGNILGDVPKAQIYISEYSLTATVIPAATWTARPTFVPTLTPSLTPTETEVPVEPTVQPTNTAVPTSTPVGAPVNLTKYLSCASYAHVRLGPGTNYTSILTLRPGSSIFVTSHYADTSLGGTGWYFIPLYSGWIYDEILQDTDPNPCDSVTLPTPQPTYGPTPVFTQAEIELVAKVLLCEAAAPTNGATGSDFPVNNIAHTIHNRMLSNNYAGNNMLSVIMGSGIDCFSDGSYGSFTTNQAALDAALWLAGMSNTAPAASSVSIDAQSFYWLGVPNLSTDEEILVYIAGNPTNPSGGYYYNYCNTSEDYNTRLTRLRNRFVGRDPDPAYPNGNLISVYFRLSPLCEQ